MKNEKRLIYVNDALEKVCETCCCDFEECKQVGFCADYANIEQLPTVDAVKVVHAHWIYDGDEVDGNMQAHCSNCFAGDVHAAWKKNSVPYCWSCGAKMDEDFKGVEIDQFKKED